jgi:hypothetical protein
MNIYANDNDFGLFPRAGGINSVHGALADWQDPNEAVAFGGPPAMQPSHRACGFW